MYGSTKTQILTEKHLSLFVILLQWRDRDFFTRRESHRINHLYFYSRDAKAKIVFMGIGKSMS